MMARKGYNLILVSRDETKLAAQQSSLSEEYDISVHTIAIDLSLRGAAEVVYETVADRNLCVQILVNNAGFNECGPFLSTSIEHEVSMLQLHAICSTQLMKFFLPDMVKSGYGRILNLGSTGSYMACPNNAVYAATKAFILQMSKAVNAELRRTGVTVTTLCPGATKTSFASKAGVEHTMLFKTFVMNPETVAAIGYRAMIKGRASVLAGLYNKLLVSVSKITPQFILNPLIEGMLQKDGGRA